MFTHVCAFMSLYECNTVDGKVGANVIFVTVLGRV